jgi:hypothetical protein
VRQAGSGVAFAGMIYERATALRVAVVTKDDQLNELVVAHREVERHDQQVRQTVLPNCFGRDAARVGAVVETLEAALQGRRQMVFVTWASLTSGSW